VRGFLRPQGVDRPVAPIVADAIEAIVSSKAQAAERLATQHG